jgi:tRNA 2-thiouridine synthesizing protein A
MSDSTTSSSAPPPSSSGDGANVTAELDLRGEICPFTFVRTRLALEALPLGAVLRVVVDHAPAARNVPRSATEWGQVVRGTTPAGEGLWQIEIVKTVL